MIYTHEIRLYPTSAQQKTMHSWLRSACAVYNAALELKQLAWNWFGKTLPYTELAKQLTELRATTEHAAVPVAVQRDALYRLDLAYKDFFRRVKRGDRPGFPRFKSAKRWRSFEILVEANYSRDGKIRIPKLGLVKCRHLRHHGLAKALRIIERAGKWYAQLVIDDKKLAPSKLPIVTAVGVDVGLATFATLSTGESIANPRYYRRAEAKLRRAQHVVSRRVKGSNRRRKAIHRVQLCHERVRNLRKNFLHHVSKDLVNRFDLIVLEDLNVKGLARTRLAKSVSDAGWSTFANYLSYKAENAGKTVVKVNPAYTSQDCSGCGFRIKKPLSVREHVCTKCGLALDRDHNAALNILARGRRATACGEAPEVGALIEAGSSS